MIPSEQQVKAMGYSALKNNILTKIAYACYETEDSSAPKCLTLIFGESWLQTWILEGYMPLFTLLIATPILHRGVNIIGFKIGVKNEPW